MRCMCPVGNWRLRRGSAVQSGNASRPQRHVSPPQLPQNSILYVHCHEDTGPVVVVVGLVAPKKHAADFS